MKKLKILKSGFIFLLMLFAINNLKAQCSLEIPITEVYCNGNSTLIDFEVENINTTSSGFTVNFAGDYVDEFPFGESFYTIEVPNNAGQNAGLYIFDSDNLNCFYEAEITLPNCEANTCEISIPITEVYCNGNSTYIDFNVENINTTSSGFTVNFAGDYIDEFPFGESFYTIEVPNNAGQNAGLYIYDSDNLNCFYEAEITLPNCEANTCEISIPITEVYCNGNSTLIDFEVENINTTSSGFTVNFAGDYIDEFPFGESFYTIEVPNNAGQNAGLYIYDSDNLNCFYEAEITLPNCEANTCEISIPITEVYCQGNSTLIDFEVENINTTSSGFTVNFAGDYVDEFPFGESFYTIEVPNNAGQNAGLYIYDSDNLNCFYEAEITLPNCEANSCEISIPITEVYCNGNSTYIDFEVENINTTSSGFTVNFAGDYIDEFPFGESFYTIEVPNNAGQNAGLYIYDSDNLNCFYEAEITLPNCTEDCFISNPEITFIECIDGGNVEITINFEYENEGSLGFNIGNSDVATSFGGTGNYSYADLPITLGPFAADGFTNYSIDIFDGEFNSDCIIVLETPVISCLFPGNADGDSEFKVNNCDVLNVGLAYGLTGDANLDLIETFYNATVLDLNAVTSTDLDFIYADCDGNGIVDFYDLDIIDQNYTVSNDINVTTNFDVNGIPIYADLPTSPIATGSSISVPIVLGDIANTANDFYGLAFSINYDTALVQNNSIALDFSDGWFLDGAVDPITYINIFEDIGRVDVALSLTNIATSTSGNGPIGEISIVLIEDIEGGIYNPNLSFTISDVKGINNQQVNYEFSVLERLAPIYASFDDNNELPNYISVFPNPVLDQLFVKNNGANKIKVELVNSLGQTVYAKSQTESLLINCENYKAGTYIIQIIENEKVYHKKIIME